MKERIVVIGGGIIGMLSALELSSAGLQVTLLEKGLTGQESSWAGGGILSPLYPWRYAPAVTALADYSQQHYADFLARLHRDTGLDPEYQPSGLLVLDMDEWSQAENWACRWHYAVEQLDEKALRQLAPALNQEVRQGMWFPAVGQVRNPRLVKSLRRALELSGVEVIEHCEVKGFDIQDGYIKSVETSHGVMATSLAVVAGGAWSALLLSETGIRPEIEPVKGQMILFRALEGFLRQIVLSDDRYLIPRRDGRILCGSTLERTAFASFTTEVAASELRAAAVKLLPGLEAIPVEHHWAGLRPASPEGIPYIGQHPEIKGLFVNAGHYRNGVILGLASAVLLADLVCERTPIVDASPYRLVRN